MKGMLKAEIITKIKSLYELVGFLEEHYKVLAAEAKLTKDETIYFQKSLSYGLVVIKIKEFFRPLV